MNSGEDVRAQKEANSIVRALSNSKRRDILSFFLDRNEEKNEVRREELVDYLSQEYGGEDETDLKVSLLHNHLPKLEKAGLVEYDEGLQKVVYRGEENLKRLIEAAEDVEEVDSILGVLAGPKRRDIVNLLEKEGSAGEQEIARELEGEYGENQDRLVGSLVHIHLPRLSQTSVIEYNEATGQASYHGDESLSQLLETLDNFYGKMA